MARVRKDVNNAAMYLRLFEERMIAQEVERDWGGKPLLDCLAGISLASPSKVIATGVNSSFAIFPLLSCVGLSPYCLENCYACKGNHCNASPQRAHYRNYFIMKRFLEEGSPSDIQALIDHLSAMIRISVAGLMGFFRIHEAGDFFSQSYLDLWIRVACSLPEISFATYTRSFQLDFACLPPNLRVWSSMDPSNVRQAQSFADKWQLGVASISPKYSEAPEGSIRCLAQTGQAPNCAGCKVCFSQTKKNVDFVQH